MCAFVAPAGGALEGWTNIFLCRFLPVCLLYRFVIRELVVVDRCMGCLLAVARVVGARVRVWVLLMWFAVLGGCMSWDQHFPVHLECVYAIRTGLLAGIWLS